MIDNVLRLVIFSSFMFMNMRALRLAPREGLKLVRRCTLAATRGLSKSYEIETLASNRGKKYVLGVDEAGRGPLAGPVVAAAVICLDIEVDERIIAADSKKLSDKKREEIFEIITNDPTRYIVASASVDHAKIDELNILKATMECMLESIMQCSAELIEKHGGTVTYDDIFGIIDGNKIPPGLPISARPLVKGDALCHSVALASIVAKVTRDRVMAEYHELYPDYNFAKHKGYPTREHLMAIHKHGASPVHRMSFKPLKGR
jgi:ribonuclease HII